MRFATVGFLSASPSPLRALCPCGCPRSLLTYRYSVSLREETALGDSPQRSLVSSLPIALMARPQTHGGVVHTAVQASACIEGVLVHLSTLGLQCPDGLWFQLPHPGPAVYTGTVIHTLYLDHAGGSTRDWSHSQPWSLGIQSSVLCCL